MTQFNLKYTVDGKETEATFFLVEFKDLATRKIIEDVETATIEMHLSESKEGAFFFFNPRVGPELFLKKGEKLIIEFL